MKIYETISKILKMYEEVYEFHVQLKTQMLQVLRPKKMPSAFICASPILERQFASQ